ncbi:MAG: acyltransferase [Candidatus Aminicenantes bacterium]|nr:MAG: acyltransferase [Candidatus Aminicenantes bacterium]
MKITDKTKAIIYFRPGDAKKVGKNCFYVNQIVWLNSDGIELGDDVRFNHGVYVNGYGGLKIGNNSGIGPYSMVHTANHAFDEKKVSQTQWDKKPVTIGEDCWIGMGVCILPGVTIGDRVIIGAGSVVAKDVPSDVIAVGNPCRPVKTRDGRKIE